MEFLFLLFALFLTTAVHELGHALAMKKYGVGMKEICLLGMGPKLFQTKSRFFGSTAITIRLLPVGAFVSHEKSEEDTLTLSQKLEIYLGGVIGNARLGIVAILVLVAIRYSMGEGFKMLTIPLSPGKIEIPSYPLLLCFFAVCSFKKTILAIMPIIGGLGIYLLFHIVTSTQEPLGTVEGSMRLAEMTPDIISMIEFIIEAQVMLIILNIAPIPPLDGGHVLQALFLKRFPNKTDSIKVTFGLVSICAGLFLIYITFIGDVKAFFALF